MENQKTIASFIQYAGKEVYFVDYSNIKTVKGLVEAIGIANNFREENIEKKGKSNILILVDITNAFVFGEALNALKRSGKELESVTKKRAIVGLNTAKRTMLNTYNSIIKSDFKAFENIEDAKKWLIS